MNIDEVPADVRVIFKSRICIEQPLAVVLGAML